MRLRESFRLSWTNITSHKLRNFLAVLSVTIGIAAVIAVVTMSAGFQDILLTTLTRDLLRANMISVSVETSREGGQSLFGTDRVFSSRDVEHVRQLPGIKAADVLAPVNGNPLKYEGRVLPGNVRITTSQEIIPIEAGAGRFVRGPGEVVVGVEVAKTICERILARERSENGSALSDPDQEKEELKKLCEHPGRTPENVQKILGQTVEMKYIDREKKVHAEMLQVVGIVKESEFISGQGSYVSIDYQGFTETIDGQEIPVYTGVIVSAADTDQVDAVAQELSDYFDSYDSDARKLLGDEKKVQVNTLKEIVDEIKKNFAQFTVWIGAVAVVALLVGMIGVMNIMLITVKERTREIGVMKATGATQGGVLKLFLMEAIFICLIGAIFGIVAGIGLGDLFNRLTVVLFQFEEAIPLVLVWNWYVIAVVTGIFVGIVSGLYPAWQAARVNPIEALRYE